MTTVEPMSTKRPATKRPLNEFLFRIVNSFTLDEFKKYTNFSDLMTEVVARREGSAPQRFSLHDRIRHNFKQNVPDESKWRRGGFRDLKLTTDFYGSDVAARIFRNVYGIEECVVPLGLPTEVRQLSSAEDNVVAKIDLTKSDDSAINISNAPKRRLKYPRKGNKQLDKSTSISGIRTYKSTSEFVEKIPTSRHLEGFDDEIIVSSTEPAATSSKRVEVISDIVIVPPTPFTDQTIQRQPDPNSDSLRNKASNQKAGPKSNLSQRKVVYVDEDTDELPIRLPANKTSTPRPKIGPKSRVSQPKGSSLDAHAKKTQDLLQDLMHTDPPPIVTEQFPALAPPERVQQLSSKVDAPTLKSRIGPKSMMTNQRNLQLPAAELSEKSRHTGSSTESHVKKSANVVLAKPKPKIGPKSRMTQARSSPEDSSYQTTQGILPDLMHTDPLPIATVDKSPTEQFPALAPPERIQQLSSKVDVPTIKSRIGPKSVMSNRQLPAVELSESTNVALAKLKPKIKPKSRMSQPKDSSVDEHAKTTQELLQDLMHTDPTPLLDRQQLPPKDLLQKSLHTGPSIEPTPKSKSPTMPASTPLSTTDELLHFSVKTAVQSGDIYVSEEMQGVFGPISKANVRASPLSDRTSRSLPVKRHSSNKPTKTSFTRSEQNTKSTENMDIEETPCQSFHVRQTYPSNQLRIGSQGEINKSRRTHGDASSVECISVAGNEAPTQCNDSSELRNIVKRSIERATQHMSKYFAEIDPNVQSLNNFWSDFHRLEAQDDSNAAETQLNSSIATSHDVESETQSQAVLNPDQLEAENEDQLQTKLQSSQVDELEQEIVDEIQSEPQSSVVDPHTEHTEVEIETKIKIEVVDHDRNTTYSSDVEIIELPPDEPIEILVDDTQQLYEELQVIRNDSEEQHFVPILISQQPSKKVSPAAGNSKGFLTSLPVIANKKRNYQPLDVVVEAVQKIPHEEFHAFSQQHCTPPSIENYEIEECTMTESQHQRYALLNDGNSIFLSSQLEHSAFNTGKTTVPKSAAMHNTDRAQPLALKRLSQDVVNRQPHKRRRCDDTIKRELNWKTMAIRSITFKPLANHFFHLELQLRNNYDTFHVQDQLSIKRILHLSNNEWKHVARVLTALHGHRYDSSATATATRTLDLPSRLMDCFVQSIPIFVRSNIQFEDFMGHCLVVSEHQPLQNKCVDDAIDPNILIKMGEINKLLA